MFVRYLVSGLSGERFRNIELSPGREGRIERMEVYYGAELG